MELTESIHRADAAKRGSLQRPENRIIMSIEDPNRIIQTEPDAAAVRKRSDEDVLRWLASYRKHPDERLREKIVNQYISLVESIARRFAGAAESAEDLAQEGYIGLITAIELYDVQKNVKFSTYATHFIIGQIKHYLRDRGKIIKEPAWLQELNQRINRTVDRLTQTNGKTPNYAEIAEQMEMTEDAVSDVMITREVFKVTSIDGGYSDNDDESGTVDMDRQNPQDVTVSFQLPVEDRIVLETAMSKLKTLEQKVLVEFYFKDLNQTEIARQLGISCNYVSHILRNSTRKLRKILTTEDLRSSQLQLTNMRKRFEDQVYTDQSIIVDSQTRLYNKCYYSSRLEEEISRASRMQSEIAIVFLYIQGMEMFIRTYGTLRGEEAIQGAVKMIREGVRRADIITRYDSNIFALILPFTGSAANIVQNRLHYSIAQCYQAAGWTNGRSILSLYSSMAHYPEEAKEARRLTEMALLRITESEAGDNIQSEAA